MVGHYQRLLSSIASPGTEVDVTYLPLVGASPVPSFWNGGYELEGEMFKRVRKANEEGYDAVIIGCSADPGLDIARRLSKIPVVAPLEAALHIASMLAQRITVITPGPHGTEPGTVPWEEIRWVEDRARLYGLRHKIASIRQVDVGTPSPSQLEKMIAEEPDKVEDILLGCFERAVAVPGPAADQIREAIEKEGVGAVYFSCTRWSGMLGPLTQEFAIPMLDPLVGALRVAEVLVRSIKYYQ